MHTLTDRDKIRLIDRVEEKISFSTIDSKFQKSANTSPNRFKGKRFISQTPTPEVQSKTATKENIIDIDVKELRSNFDRIPGHIKYQRKLIQEIETVQFSLFLGLSNLELL